MNYYYYYNISSYTSGGKDIYIYMVGLQDYSMFPVRFAWSAA